MELTFAQVSNTLARAHQIADTKRPAFIARLQHLQKLKFPEGINTGRGRAAKYRVGHLFQIGVALELFQLGLTPERAKKVIEDDMHAVAMAAAMTARDGMPKRTIPFPIFLYCDPAVLSASLTHDHDWTSQTFFYAGMGQVLENFQRWFTEGVPRMAFFSVSAMVQDLALFTCEDDDEFREFYSELEHWAHPYIHNVDVANASNPQA